MARPVNQHCANCIGTLSFSILTCNVTALHSIPTYQDVLFAICKFGCIVPTYCHVDSQTTGCSQKVARV